MKSNLLWLLLLSSCMSLPRPVVLPGYLLGDTPLCEGVYLNVESFLEDSPNLRPFEVDHFHEIRKKLLAVRDGTGMELEAMIHNGIDIAGQVWCLVAGGVTFVKYEGKLYPVTQLGSLSSFFIMNAGERMAEVEDLGEVKLEKRQSHQTLINIMPLNDVVETNVSSLYGSLSGQYAQWRGGAYGLPEPGSSNASRYRSGEGTPTKN